MLGSFDDLRGQDDDIVGKSAVPWHTQNIEIIALDLGQE